MDGITTFFEYGLIFIGILAVITGLTLLAANYFTKGLVKERLSAIARRLGATAGVMLVGLPLQPIPEIDGIYDIGALIMLALYWYSLKTKLRTASNASEKHAHILSALPRLLQILKRIKRR